MKTKSTLSILLILSVITFRLQAQTCIPVQGENGGEYPTVKNDASNPCITPEVYKMVKKNCDKNAALFIHDDQSRSVLSAPLIWPLQAASGFNDCSFYYISAHVDQDTNATAFKDYNCGTIAYDGHRGTDIAIGPYPFYKMDHNQVEVIAAAAGTIIDKHDGEFDKNCLGIGSNVVANYAVIQHSDGSRALYWHMKSGSLTNKIIGQTVVAGEYLGVVGSSGSSSGPHLHFEVWNSSTQSTRNDPFSGTCNYLNASSWWSVQKPYREPAVIKVSINTTDVVLPACPATETPNESTSFTIPFQGPGLAPGYAKFYIFIRNETSGTTVSMSILNPNSTVFNSWTHNCTANFNMTYWGYSKLLPTIPGTYTFQATYNGITCSQTFDIVATTGISETNSDTPGFLVYPNPSNSSSVTIQFNRVVTNGELVIYNEYGQKIKTIKNISDQQVKLNRDNLPGGLYFFRLVQDSKIIGTEKFSVTN